MINQKISQPDRGLIGNANFPDFSIILAAGVSILENFLSFLKRVMHQNIHLFNLLVAATLVLQGHSLSAQSSNNNLRIISLAPHVTEIIYKLNAGQLLIGRTDFCNYPSAANNIESVGGYLNIDFEKMVTLKPDLVFQFPNNENQRKLEGLGFRVISAPNETIDDILGSIKVIGEALDLVEQADRLLQDIEDTLQLVSKTELLPKQPVAALLVIGRQQGSLSNLYLAGPATYISELWSLCGGVNAFPEVSYRYFPVNAEDIITRRVDVILEFHPDWELDPAQLDTEKKVWSHIFPSQSFNKHRIYIFPQQFFVIPGPRITRIAVEFSKLVEALTEETE